MNSRLLTTRTSQSLLCGIAILLSASAARAQLITNNFYYQGNQSASPGTNWSGTGVTAYWTNTFTGTKSTPVAGATNANATNYNFYILTNNGTLYGNGTTTTLIRNPYSTATPSTISFPGDSLILQTNTSLRLKNLGGGGTFVSGGIGTVVYCTPTNVFPGNNGQPGLVLDGGVLNNGVTDAAFVIQGTMYAVPGTQSYINAADTLNSDVTGRAVIIQSQLSGSGAIVLLNCASVASGTANVAYTPTPFTATNNTFSGTWIVKQGWLQGNGDGTSDGYTSLGTNSSTVYDIDPMWTPPAAQFNANSVFFNGPSVLDFGSGVANCCGSLILSNGGQLYLHGNVIFSSVNLEGTFLAPGTYTYPQLVAMAPLANFSPSGFPKGSGTLTVQACGQIVIPGLITSQPMSEILYSNLTAVFSAAGIGTPAPSFYWQSNGVNLASGGNVTGATSPTLTISGVNGTDAASYQLVVSNAIGASTSSVVTLEVVGPVEPYEKAVDALNPLAFYQFNETTNPSTGTAEAFDYVAGFNGVYGNGVQNGFDGVTGPTAALGFPGFSSTNLAAYYSAAAGNNVECPPWNYSGNSMTISAWINPAGIQQAASGLAICRGTSIVAGLVYGGIAYNGSYPLGYVWNNDPTTYNWVSGLVPPVGQWSLVTLVITPSSATIYMMNTNGLASATQVYPNIVQTFNTNEYIGEDAAFEGGNGTRSFQGSIDDVAVFPTALTQDQVANLFYAATQVTNYAPVIDVFPLSQTAYVGQTIQLYAGADGSEPLTYQWAAGAPGTVAAGGPYTNLANGNGISGVQSATLTIANVSAADYLDYVVIVSNTAGIDISTNDASAPNQPATLNVQPTNAAIFNIFMSAQEPAGADWNTGSYWSDSNPASVSVVSEPGSTYEVMQGARLRTPSGPINAVFPGDMLLLDGTGNFINNPAAGTTQGEIRTKQLEPSIGNASVTFPLLVMAGGQIDNGNAGTVNLLGAMQVISNAPIYVDSSGGTGRAYVLGAYLTGGSNANIEYHDFDASLSGGLYVTGTSNTYSGTWNDVIGPLVGVSSNCLGTNTITVGSNGVLQTMYNISNSTGNLILSGRMFLTQTDTFASVIVGTGSLTNGTYTAAQLSANYPAYFPSNWASYGPLITQTNANGSITVLANSGATVLQNPQPANVTVYPSQSVQFSALGGGNAPLFYHWALNGAKLTDGVNAVTGAIIQGSLTPTLTLSNIAASQGGSYTIIVTNSVSSVTSAPAVLTILPTYPAQNITLNQQEPAGDDWNTASVWNDPLGGVPASQSALEYPGSTYEVVNGTLLRTPAESQAYTNFPGVQLTVDGNGVWVDLPNPSSLVGEIRFKGGQSGEIVYFPLLVMAGGQLDNGNASTLADIAGNMCIESNTTFYADAAGSTADRPYQVDAFLFGSGNIQYIDSDATFSGYLNITCPTNAFTGMWIVQQGPLLGSGSNSLGTNSIIVETNAALETLYNINDLNASLTISNGGMMFLHQNDTFQTVNINGTGLPNGTFTFAQLQSMFPSAFPSTWVTVANSPVNTGSGSIKVLVNTSSQISLGFTYSAKNLTLSWSEGTLVQSSNLLGPWITNTNTSPYVVTPTNGQQYFKVLLP